MNLLQIFSICWFVGLVYSACEIDIPALKLKGIVAECIESNVIAANNVKVDCASSQSVSRTVTLKCQEYYYAGEESPRVLTSTCLTNSTWSENLDRIVCYPDCGRKIKSEEQPWRVKIYEKTNDIQNDLCYGTLISKYEVLVVENCMRNFTAMQLGVELVTYQKGIFFSSVESVKLQSHTTPDGSSGLVILSMQREATIEDYAMPICLPSANDVFRSVQLLQPGDSLEIPWNNHMQNLTLVNATECRNSAASKNDYPFCVSGQESTSHSKSWTGIAIGDYRKMLLGVLAENAASTGNHLSYVNVQLSMMWIKNTLKEVSRARNDHRFVKSLSDSSLMVSVILEHLNKKDPTKKSAEILKQISYLASKNIPTLLFTGNMPNENTDLSRSISILVKFSLLNTSGESISVLPGLQKSLQQYLFKSQSEEELILKSTTKLIQRQFNSSSPSGTKSAATTHAMTLWKHVIKFKNLVTEYEHFHLSIYENLFAEGRFNETITFSAEILPLIKGIYPENHNFIISLRKKVQQALEHLGTTTEKSPLSEEGTTWSDEDITKLLSESTECSGLEENFEDCFGTMCEMEIPDFCLD